MEMQTSQPSKKGFYAAIIVDESVTDAELVEAVQKAGALGHYSVGKSLSGHL